jgi:hypothetical protein
MGASIIPHFEFEFTAHGMASAKRKTGEEEKN